MSRVQGALRAGVVAHEAIIELVQPTGSRTYATFRLGGTPVVAELEAHDVEHPNQRLQLALDMNRAVLIDPQTEKVL